MIISMAIAMVFHYLKNKEIDGSLKYIKPKMGIIKGFKMVQMDLSYLKWLRLVQVIYLELI